MMNKRSFVIVSLVLLMILAMAGCQLAQPDTGAAAGQDRLIGVLVTTEHLDALDAEASLEGNWKVGPDGELIIDDDETQKQGRLYAKLISKTITDEATGDKINTEDYDFEGVNGFPCFSPLVPATVERERYHTTISDDAISDRMSKISSKGEVYSIELDGTIYISIEAGWSVIYLNPVYQSADGQVFVTSAGMGTSLGVYDNETNTRIDQNVEDNIAQSISETYTKNENGKVISYSTSVKLTIQEMIPPKKIVILQLDQNSAILTRAEYEPGKLPKAIAPERNAEYLLVETHKTGPKGKAQVSRTLFEKGKESLDTFYCREDGVCVKQWTQLDWAK